MARKTWIGAAVALAAFVVAGPAAAHPGSNMGGFQEGLLHPISGLDHVVAMIAVGLWGGILGRPAIWLLPVVFPLMMAASAAYAVAGFPMVGIEVGIGLSGVVLGLAVLFALRPPLWAAMVAVGFFAVFHGYAHGAELPNAVSPAAYAAGFVLSTGILHLIGIGIGVVWRYRTGQMAVRAAGAAIAATGLGFLTGAL